LLETCGQAQITKRDFGVSRSDVRDERVNGSQDDLVIWIRKVRHVGSSSYDGVAKAIMDLASQKVSREQAKRRH
jgi:hypothetical protein